MKRGTPDHPKTLALMAALSCSKPVAVGMLELLWHWTARYAPLGDLGRWGDDAIAQAVGWTEDPGVLVAALVTSGWLDEHDEHRLVVHDWHEHAEDAVRKYVTRNELQFASRHVRRRSGKVLPAVAVASAIAPCPLPQPEPLPEPARPATGARANPLVGDRLKLETECLRLVREVAALTGDDPTEVIRAAADFKGSERSKVNPATMSDDRLMLTVSDLRKRLASEKSKRNGAGDVLEREHEEAYVINRLMDKRAKEANGFGQVRLDASASALLDRVIAQKRGEVS